jgi:hypothetical protein
MGGKNVSANVGRESTRDVVFGHTHKFSTLDVPKLGDNNKITVVNVGCALPWGEIKEYARLGQTGWWWGVCLITIFDGKIIAVKQKPMLSLKNDYA